MNKLTNYLEKFVVYQNQTILIFFVILILGLKLSMIQQRVTNIKKIMNNNFKNFMKLMIIEWLYLTIVASKLKMILIQIKTVEIVFIKD